MPYPSHVEPALYTRSALQHMTEMLEKMVKLLPEHEQPQAARSLTYIRQARTNLVVWIEENRP